MFAPELLNLLYQAGLRTAYMSLVNQLGRKGIMYLQAEAGLFVMLDLREFLETSSKVFYLMKASASKVLIRVCPASTFPK